MMSEYEEEQDSASSAPSERNEPRMSGCPDLSRAAEGTHCTASNATTETVRSEPARVARCCGMPSRQRASSVEWIESKALPLSKTELAVLRCLITNEPRWLTSDTIIAACLGTTHATDTSLIRVHVHAIRKKLGALGKHVQSRRGFGYRFRSGI